MGNKEIHIGICGATRSGKSTLATNIIKHFESDIKKIIHLDEYFALELLYKYKNNWEIPEAISWKDLLEDISNDKYKIHYSKKTYIICEGFLLFKEPLFHDFDKSIFIWVSKEEAKKRRMQTKPVSEDYFENLVWPNYLKNNYHLAKMNKNKDERFGGDILVLDSTKESIEEMTSKAIKFILNDKTLNRDLKNEQNLLDIIETQYNELN